MKLAIASIAILLAGCASVSAAEPRTHVNMRPTEEWPCLAPGWTAGDKWGPGPLDIVPDVPPCEVGAVSSIVLPATDTE